ncbi:ketopantoate reductase [Demequina sp. TTPB684]|uniref:ketopantoate reductase family protein n=1 Tax=unclassified Demequina TaxID=2620311 RepID=UPI001CF4AC33|nr:MULTISPECIES: 2-dehydropantoate 2-reductase N-terminal domain-containing protein [unclassified Demequina]MCB2412210.1 ketopantoate reductase [Demequina sp. TTPB684]UPU87316.1 ketopantoate reductase [Demequina sp. TMPB413]
MKILMIGRGVIACVYGWAFEQAGHVVEFLVRPGRAAKYARPIDLDLIDSRRRGGQAQVLQEWSPRYRETLSPDHDVDLIILSVPHYSLADAVDLLSTRTGDATVLMFGNMWQEPLDAIAPLPSGQVAWGFPQGGGGFDATGALRGVLLSSVVFGHFGEGLTERELAVRGLFHGAGFRVCEQHDFRGWLLLHTAVGAGLYSQALQRGAMADLVRDTGAFAEAMRVGRELLPLLRARGVDLSRHRGTSMMLRAPSWLAGAAMSLAISRIAAARRSFEAQADPNALEPRLVCRDVEADARRLGVPTPRLSAISALFADAPHPR